MDVGYLVGGCLISGVMKDLWKGIENGIRHKGGCRISGGVKSDRNLGCDGTDVDECSDGDNDLNYDDNDDIFILTYNASLGKGILRRIQTLLSNSNESLTNN